MTDHAAFRRILTALCGAHGRNYSDAIADAYWLACEDLDDREFSRGVSAALTGDKAWPTPARIRELAGKLEVAPSDDRLGLEAWRVVRDSMGNAGRYRSVDFGPVVNSAIASLGGWQGLCLQTDEELERFLRPQFVKAVKAYRGTVPANAPAYLPGIAEIANQAVPGTGVEPVLRIGIDGLHDAPLLPAATQLPTPDRPALPAPEGDEPLSRDVASRLMREIAERLRRRVESGPETDAAEIHDTAANGPALTAERPDGRTGTHGSVPPVSDRPGPAALARRGILAPAATGVP